MQALCRRRFISSAHDLEAAGMYATILPSDRPFSSPAHSCLLMAFEDSSNGALGGLAWVGIERAAQASGKASLTDETPLQISTVEAKDFVSSRVFWPSEHLCHTYLDSHLPELRQSAGKGNGWCSVADAASLKSFGSEGQVFEVTRGHQRFDKLSVPNKGADRLLMVVNKPLLRILT